MRESEWFKRLEIALEYDSGLEIFLLLGRGDLARPALAALARALARFGSPYWHQLDPRGGLDRLLAWEQPRGVLHLVHGFEQLSPAIASDTAARLNVNRDRLAVLAAPAFFWIPEDFYEELMTQAPDFVSWRTQVSVVPIADLLPSQ